MVEEGRLCGCHRDNGRLAANVSSGFKGGIGVTVLLSRRRTLMPLVPVTILVM